MQLIHRLAQPTDVQLYFDWANDPDTRRQSFSTEPIPLATHQRWFARKLADPNALLLVFEDEAGRPVGQVRFDRSEPVAEQQGEGGSPNRDETHQPEAPAERRTVETERSGNRPAGHRAHGGSDARPVVIGVSVGAPFRGRGLATQLLRTACALCRERWGNVVIWAYIKPDNRASVRAFERAGFVFSHESGTFGVDSVVYQYGPQADG